jgi:hypothetical protein
MTEDADPQHYFRLLLQRLLETQQCMAQISSRLPLPIQTQLSINASTLSEIKSWLEATGGNWHLTRSPSSVPAAETSGHAWYPPVTREPGHRPWPSVDAALMERRHGSLQGPSSQRFDSTGQPLVRSSTGRLVFLPKSSDGNAKDI